MKLKRKIFSILFALVLACSLSLIPAVPAAAAADTLTVIPYVREGSGTYTATWTTAEQYAGTSSVKLTTDRVDGLARVKVALLEPIALSDLDSISYWVKTSKGYPPYVNIYLDENDDGVWESGIDNYLIAEPYMWQKAEPGSYFPNVIESQDGTAADTRAYQDGDTNHDWYDADWAGKVDTWTQVTIDDDFYVFHETTALDLDDLDTLASYKTATHTGANAARCDVAGIDGTEKVLHIKIQNDCGAIKSAVDGDENIAYVDDVTIDSTTYALEGTDDDYTTIQSAITAAKTGDIISVATGVYSENLVIATENITLQAASSPIIDGGSMLGPGVEITADDVTFQGFTIRNFTCTPASGMGAIWVKAGGAKIDDNIIYDITTQGDPIDDPAGIGIAVWTESGAHTDIQVTNNVIHDVGSIGIRVRDNYEQAEKLTAVQNVLIEGNEVYKCGNSNVLIAGFVEGVTVRDNEIYDSSLPNQYGIRVIIGAEDITIEGNYIHDNLRNIVLAGTDNVTIADNTIEDTASGSKNIYITNNYNLDNSLPWNIGTLTADTLSTNIEISSNNVTDAGHGVKIQNFGASAPSLMAATTTINFNNISGNTVFGVENEVATDVDATNNWWGNASGPERFEPLPPGYESYGDNVSANVDYQPWLLEAVTETTPQPPTFEKTLALRDGWTLVSTDKEVATGTTWVGTDNLSPATILAYKYTPSAAYEQVTLATQLTSVDAYYVKTDGGGGVGINYSTDAPGVVTKNLVGPGWNIISCAGETDAYKLLSQLRYVQIGEQQGVGITNLIGQSSYNQYLPTSISKPLVTDTDWGCMTGWGFMGRGAVTLNAFDGYWVQMNADKSFGVIPD